METGICLIKISTFLFAVDKETLFCFYRIIAQAYGVSIVITEPCIIKFSQFLFWISKWFHPDKETLFWIFSTIAQVYGALIAILGVFTVYALEWLQQSIEWSRRDMVQQLKSIRPECKSEYIYLSLDDQLDFVKKTFQDICPRENNFDEFIRTVRIIYDRRVQREVFSKDFVTLVSLFISVLIFSILGLFFVKNGAVTNTLLLIICPFGLFFLSAKSMDKIRFPISLLLLLISQLSPNSY